MEKFFLFNGYGVYPKSCGQSSVYRQNGFAHLPIEWGKQSLFPSDNEGLNISGALVEKVDRVANGNNTIVYFVSEDCVTEEARVEKAGGTLINSKMSIGKFGFVSILLDTEGNTIGLHSRK